MQQATLTVSQQAPGTESLLQKPLKNLTFVAFDTEATGRHPMISGLLEISGVKFRGSGELLEVRTQLINPGRPIPSDVTTVHGITDEMVADSPGFAEVVPQFVQWMKTQPGGINDDKQLNVFVAHNATFDVNFLQVALTRLGLPLPANPVLDTLKLAPRFVRETKNHRLKTLVENLENKSDATFHRAEADSRHVMNVFLNIISRAGATSTLGDLIDAGGVLFFSKPYELIEDHKSAHDKRVHRIGEAIHCGADLQIHYRGHGPKFRQVTPLSVLYFGRRFFLRAYCHTAGHERTFRVNRISSLDLVSRAKSEC